MEKQTNSSNAKMWEANRERFLERVVTGEPALGVLQAKFPAAFSLPPKPLKVGVKKELVAMRQRGELEMSMKDLDRALFLWFGQVDYIEALIAGGPRIDLSGQTQGKVEPKHIEFAKNLLVTAKERKTPKGWHKRLWVLESKVAPTATVST